MDIQKQKKGHLIYKLNINKIEINNIFYCKIINT